MNVAKVLITGNTGYIGPVVSKHLNEKFDVSGIDTGFFGLQRNKDIKQFPNDVRNIGPHFLRGYQNVIHLAAISNDPMGKEFESVTDKINRQATLDVAIMAKRAGVRSFVFASSCSVYGFSEETATEKTKTNPLTAYAKSKLQAEKDLKHLADHTFSVTCLRFATACGASPNMRLDLVLNDFIASAMSKGKIEILSDGTPLRPLIDVSDMARAFHWAMLRGGKPFEVVNVGRENYTIKELAEQVAAVIPAEITINQNAAPDKRSYRVGFEKFKELAPDHQPLKSITDSITDIREELIAFDLKDFRNTDMIRLNALRKLKETGRVDEGFFWV